MAADDFRADIHCHSNCSDGSDTPLELLSLAKKIGLKGLSITDHDTIAAYTPEFLAQAEKDSILILSGVEISSELDDTPVHILGYGFDLVSSFFDEFLKDIQMRRIERNRLILKLLALKKMPVAEEELPPAASIGRPHIAALMVKKKYVGSIREAFDRYLKDGAPCYAAGFKHSPNEVIEQVRAAGGKAVLAHPHFYKNKAFLQKVFTCPFDGIECYYAALHKELERPWLKLAEERGWIVTGGSDYHGTLKHIQLGASWVGESTFNKLRSR